MSLPIDVLSENIVPLADLGKAIGQRLHYKRVWRYVSRGCLNASRTKRVKLETIRAPSGLATSTEAYARFIEALNE